MLDRIDTYTLDIVAPSPDITEVALDLDPLPRGTDVTATISLSLVRTVFGDNRSDPKFAANAYITEWTVYNPDGTESNWLPGTVDFTRNGTSVKNCARMRFVLTGIQVVAVAQINIFRFIGD
jgi:hypothetical protein